MTSPHPRQLILLLFFIITSPILRGDDPANFSLVRLVNADAGLVLRLQDFKHNAPLLLDSHWLKTFRNSPVHAGLCASGDVKKIINAGKHIEEITGEPLLVYLNTIFGEDVIVALYPDDERSPYGVLYTAAESELALQQSIARWKRLDPQLSVTYKHLNTEYTARRPQNDRNSDNGRLFYCSLGRYFILSDREQAIRSAIELYVTATSTTEQPDSAKSLADTKGYSLAREKLPAEFWISVYFTPHHWKRALGHLQDKNAEEPEVKVLNHILMHSQAMMLGLRFQEGVFGQLLIKPDDSALAFLTPFSSADNSPTPSRPTPLPCIAVAQLRLPGGLTAPLLTSLLERKVPNWNHLREVLAGIFLGHDLLAEILPRIGPDWQLSLHPLTSNEAGHHLPCELIASVNYESGDLESSSGKTSFRTAVANGIHSLLHLIALGESDKRNPVEVARTDVDDTTTWKISVHSKNVAVLSLDDASLSLASSTNLIANPSQTLLQDSPLYQESLAKHSPGSPLSIWFHLPSLVEVLAAEKDPDQEFLDALRLFDVLWFTLRIEDGILRADAAAQKLVQPPNP